MKRLNAAKLPLELLVSSQASISSRLPTVIMARNGPFVMLSYV